MAKFKANDVLYHNKGFNIKPVVVKAVIDNKYVIKYDDDNMRIEEEVDINLNYDFRAIEIVVGGTYAPKRLGYEGRLDNVQLLYKVVAIVENTAGQQIIVYDAFERNIWKTTSVTSMANALLKWCEHV